MLLDERSSQGRIQLPKTTTHNEYALRGPLTAGFSHQGPDKLGGPSPLKGKNARDIIVHGAQSPEAE